ncbi:helix-turn-helix domain-containing protein [Actinomadura sp. 6N118]|uniref:helix-turn-helix domain-containing protein n=1 Tax=Actinomadura sp. 6N118 TaxID=3375151 RepID=UPI0037ACC6CA
MPLEARPDGTIVYGYMDPDVRDPAKAFDAVLVRTTTPYAADTRLHRFGALTACDIAGEQPAQVSPHTAPLAQDFGIALGLMLEGDGTIEQDGRLCPLSPGDVVFYSGGHPYRLNLGGSYRWLVVRLDPGTISLAQRVPNTVANQEISGSPCGRILSSMLVELAHRGHRLGPLSRGEMGEHVTGVVRTLVREYGGRPAQPAHTRTLERILEHIDRHLDRQLSPAQIAAAHHISVRTLHALFQKQGETLGDHIRRRRLDRIHRDLADPALAHLPSYAVAARWGVHDPSHFGKLFKAEYGLSPREFRARFRPGNAGT